MVPWNQEVVIKAWNFASKIHNGQNVPGSKLPYINHIGHVAMEIMARIAQHGGSISRPDLAIQCALLHDSIEDTETTCLDIENMFGADVANGVLALTKNSALETKEVQMRDSLSRISKQPDEIWMVKMADRITNLQPPPKGWNREKIGKYHKEAKIIHASLKRADAVLAERLEKKILDYEIFC